MFWENSERLALKTKFTYLFSLSKALAFAAERILEHPSSWRIEEIMRFLWTICNDKQVSMILQIHRLVSSQQPVCPKCNPELFLPGPLEWFATFAHLVLIQSIKSERRANGKSQLITNIEICSRPGNDWMILALNFSYLCTCRNPSLVRKLKAPKCFSSNSWMARGV